MSRLRFNFCWFTMASIEFILLLLVPIASTEKCTNPLPALMQMASGVDITTLDLFPVGNVSENRGLLENIFNFTCSAVKIGEYLDKLDYDFSDYDLPDQIADISVNPASTTSDGYVLLMPDWASVRAALLNRLDLGYSDLTYSDEALGAFSRNPKYTSLLKQHFESNKAFYDFETRSSELVPTIQVYIDSNSNDTRPRVNQSILSHDFLEYITHQLPPKYEDNPSAYDTFIARFGTHYFGKVYISDYDYVQFALAPDYLLDTSDGQIEDDMRTAYDAYFKAWKNGTMKDILNSVKIILVYSAVKNGSSLWMDTLTGVQHWSKQFNSGLAIRRARVWPIEDLIDNQTIQAQVQIAVQMHRIRAQLEELANMYKFTSDYYQRSTLEVTVYEQLKKLFNLDDGFKQLDQIVNITNELYHKVQRHFLKPVIDDLYVIASTKLEFAKQICAFSGRKFLTGHWHHCPDKAIQQGQTDTSAFYLDYNWPQKSSRYSDRSEYGYRNALDQSRWLNQQYGLSADITNGLTASCGAC